jgi:hypothetical protein
MARRESARTRYGGFGVLKTVSFFEDYGGAREAFLKAAEGNGYRLLRYRLPTEESPELFQDYALFPRDPKKWMVHISGVHGIEGYAGSAVQTELLNRRPKADGPSLLFVHGFNPSGMAFYRRANDENVDLNRNFRDQRPPDNPDYQRFRPYLIPRSNSDFLSSSLQALWHRILIGGPRTSQAIAGGQHLDKDGLFFAGMKIQREIHLFYEFLRSHLQGAETVCVLDVHTGLGDFGAEILFAEDNLSFFEKHLLAPISQPDPLKGTYRAEGNLGLAVSHALKNQKVFYLLQEFGTRSAAKTINTLRQENFQWQRRKRGEPRPEPLVRKMLSVFLPPEPHWRENLLNKGILRWDQLERALASPG